ncbi:uncharacterized protein BDR25DRAFT_344872 [Lindgomyces ingoldianus]|uniref:Uncharacterized protein n=1 Tax=Lindgomyces ingoldianus TaxID=673940 RepID=A0ACB6QKW2_9PLEO|nr:uncharacterized protein BDR25DRAFT_344872 [Lindgomyces ingoldianus]KAF2467507.1 hypothetical protein BDR25DRAFT_344872 [Lindgomyces ingoldianus]
MPPSSNLVNSDNPHHAQCFFHHSVLNSICNGLKRNGGRCTSKANQFPIGYLPTCKLHIDQYQRAGSCRAIEECGERCGRPCHYRPPLLEVCREHANGTPTIPSYILKIPTEIRMAIFWYLFPNYIKAKPFPQSPIERGMHAAILQVNRQMYDEASTVLYQQVPFRASIECDEIFICHNFIKPSLRTIARRIRNLEVTLHIGHKPYYGTGIHSDHGISFEDFRLYQVRHNARKLVELLQPTIEDGSQSGLHQLSLSPQADHIFNWTREEAIQAIAFAIGPFRNLCNIRLASLKSASLSSASEPNIMVGVSETTSMPEDEAYFKIQRTFGSELKKGPETTLSHRKMLKEIDENVEKIESLVQLLKRKDAIQAPSWHMTLKWSVSIFGGADRVLHYARFLREHEELSEFCAIRQAIQQRWLRYQEFARRQQCDIADHILALSDKTEQSSLKARFPSSFRLSSPDVEGQDTLEPIEVSLWPELEMKLGLPFLHENSVEEWEDDECLYFKHDNQVRFRLKTPQIMREKRSDGSRG